MIKELDLVNFKCFDELRLKCTPLNILCGLNGMGKSTIIQALLVLRQSSQSRSLEQGRLALAGSLVDLGTGRDVLFEDANMEEIGFSLVLDELDTRWHASFGYSPHGDHLPALPTDCSEFPIPSNISPFGGRCVYVDAERVGPRKHYPLSQMKAGFGEFGRRSELAWNLLLNKGDSVMSIMDRRINRLGRRRVIDVVDHWLQHISPGVHLRLKSFREGDAATSGFVFDRDNDVETRRYRATNVGFGLSYVVPVILALLSESGTLCLIENPEAHLHPRGQTRVAELAVKSACEGLQIFVETHSDHFLDGVRIAIREGLISSSDVMVHFFERENNKTMVKSLNIDKDGRIPVWPSGFFDQYEKNLVRLLSPRDGNARDDL